MAKDKKGKKDLPTEKKKINKSLFIILFPALLITVLACSFGILMVSGLSIALLIFQAVLLKNFLDNYYAKSI